MEEVNREALIQKIIELEAVKKELQARKFSKDLFLFNTEVLSVAQQGELAPFHKELCDFIITPGKRKKLVLVPRSHLKSTLVTVGYSLMRIVENPNVRILIANATYDMACTFLSQIKKHLRFNEKLKGIYGDLSQNADKWSENMLSVVSDQFYAKKEATVTAYGIGGNLVSQHYDLIIMDDVVNRDGINTPEQIEKTVLFYKDALDLLEPTGMVLVVGTRWHQNDLYGWILDRDNPARLFESFDIFFRKAYDGDLSTGEGFSALFPQKYSRETLQELRREKGPYEFESQYMNNPTPTDDAKFKQDWMKRCGEEELRSRNVQYYTMVDPAIGELKDSDNTAIITIGVDEFNNWFIANIIWGKMLPNDIITQMFANWEAYHPRKMGLEMVAFQKALKYSLTDEMRKRNIFLPLEELKASSSKMERIEGLIPRYANGTMYHLNQCPYIDKLEEELLWYPRGKHDDLIDALAYGLQIAKPSRKQETRSKTWDDEDRPRNHRYLY
jgi:predicted phage terminase large subunit-like protein